MWQRIVQWWRDRATRQFLLLIITGLVVAQIHHGVEHHWKSWDTWEDFFLAWFSHSVAVLVFGAIAFAAIYFTHEFFLGKAMPGFQGKEKPDFQGMFFCIVMTLLVGALCIWYIAMSPSDDDDFDDSSAAPYYLASA